MRKLLFLALPLAFLTACVDTTGLTATIHTDAHPQTSQNALVTVSEYADLQCPACRSAHIGLTKPLIEKYGTKIAYDFHHFPLSMHPYAMRAAEASECAADQGKFWQFLDHDYENQDDLSPAALSEWAKTLGLDVELFDRCVDSHIKRKAIQASYDEGVARGVGGTPTYFVNGQKTVATMDELSKAIDSALKQAEVLR